MQKIPGTDMSYKTQEDKQVTSQSVHMCVCVSAAVSSPGTGPAEACSYHLKFNLNSHSVAVPGCDNTQTHITAVALSLVPRLHCLHSSTY